MENERRFTISDRKSDTNQQQATEGSKMAGKPRLSRAKCSTAASSSHTKFLRKPRPNEDFVAITRDQYHNVSESISSSNTFHCLHGPEGKVYTEKGLLKRNILKKLDPIPLDPKWNDECPTSYGWEIAEKIDFLVDSGCAMKQLDRLRGLLRDLVRISNNGFRVDFLNCYTNIINFLLDTEPKLPDLRDSLKCLLCNFAKPIILTTSSDVVKYFDAVRNFFGFTGFLLMRLEEDELFKIISEAVLWHLSAPDSVRGQGVQFLPLKHTLTTASIIIESVIRMLPVTSSYRFPTFLKIALILAVHSEDNCIEMMKENVVENIFYRFNPYFPERPLPDYDMGPADCQDPNVRLGDSSVHLSTTMSILLVLLKTTKEYLLKNPQFLAILPYPNAYSLRCFIWAYRYECRARDHRHERITLTVIATILLKCFGSRLWAFSSWLMPDIMSLSVKTELPLRDDWTQNVHFNTMQQDVHFKKILIYLVVDSLKVFPYNSSMVSSRHWLLGIMYLLDPVLCHLRANWSSALFEELRKTALQALVCSVPICDSNIAKEYSLIRRLMWYIEWYSESPYEISTLYWCLRVLQVSVYHRKTESRENSIRDLFHTHGIIIIMKLCYTLLSQKVPPVEKVQAVISVCLRLLTNAAHLDIQSKVTCYVYSTIKWPSTLNNLTNRMLKVVLHSLEKHYLISDRWLVSLLNCIWEAIIWHKAYIELFVKNDGVYKLLDLITMTRPAVQCIALALICDIVRAGFAVGHLVTWRATPSASDAVRIFLRFYMEYPIMSPSISEALHQQNLCYIKSPRTSVCLITADMAGSRMSKNPLLVRRGSTIATLLAAIFRDDCKMSNIRLDEYGFFENMEYPIMSPSISEALHQQNLCYIKSPRTSVCLITADMAGSRMSKAFALLHMLSKDLEEKVDIADEAYNLYKNIKLSVEDETVMILCSHYLTLKLIEVWSATQLQSPGFVYQDKLALEEYMLIGSGWAKEIKRQQEDAVKRDEKKELDEESSLHAFLGRIRLNIALDALKEIHCKARSADRQRIVNSLIHDAVFARHRHSVYAKRIDAPVLKTYSPTLDDANITGQNVKVRSIQDKQPRTSYSSSSLHNHQNP